jgi:uncharacterized membrane protein YphA (DoxX/SURF4 family)
MNLRAALETSAPAPVILVRLVVGAVFLSEGIQKYLFPAELGVGRFARIGFAQPQVLAPLVGGFEIACGALVLIGLVTRIAALPLFGIILTALVTTKLPILLGTALGPFQPPAAGPIGFWTMAHEARADWSMLLCSAFLLLVGGGRWSLDAKLVGRRGL